MHLIALRNKVSLKWVPYSKISLDFHKVQEELWHWSHFSENYILWRPLRESCCVSR